MAMKAWHQLAIVCLVLLAAARTSCDPYKTLGVAKYATPTEIKQAFKRLAVQLHPDKVQDHSTETDARYIRVQEAYAVLSNEERRSEYDMQHSVKKAEGLFAGFAEFFKSSWQLETTSSNVVLLTHARIVHDVLGSEKPWIIQVSASSVSARFAALQWERIAAALGSDAQFGRLSASDDPQLALQLLRSARSPFLGLQLPTHDLLPAVLGFPPGSRSFSEATEYLGPVLLQSVSEFLGSKLLGIPKLHSTDVTSLGKWAKGRVLAGKVAMVIASEDPEASLSTRIAAQKHCNQVEMRHLVVDRQGKQALKETYRVRSYPAALVFPDVGLDAVVYERPAQKLLDMNSIALKHRLPLVSALSVDTMKALGCGWGPGTDHKDLAQACAVLCGGGKAGMVQARGLLARLASTLRLKKSRVSMGEGSSAGKAFRRSALRLAWLDAGNQQKFIEFHRRNAVKTSERQKASMQVAPTQSNTERHKLKRIELIVYQPGAANLSKYIQVPHRFSIFSGDILSANDIEVAGWLSEFVEGSEEGVVSLPDWPPLLISNSVSARTLKLLMGIRDTASCSAKRSMQVIRHGWYSSSTSRHLSLGIVNSLAWSFCIRLFMQKRKWPWLFVSCTISVLTVCSQQSSAGVSESWWNRLALN